MRPQRKRVTRRDASFLYYDSQDSIPTGSHHKNTAVEHNTSEQATPVHAGQDHRDACSALVKHKHEAEFSVVVKIEQELPPSVDIKVEEKDMCLTSVATEQENITSRLAEVRKTECQTVAKRSTRKRAARRDDMFCYYDDAVVHNTITQNPYERKNVRQSDLSDTDIAFTPENQCSDSSDEWTDDEEVISKSKRKRNNPGSYLIKKGKVLKRRQHDGYNTVTPDSTTSEYRCDQCTKTYVHKYNLVRHVRENHHSQRRPCRPSRKLPCDLCHLTFTSRYTLRRHKHHVHGGDGAGENLIDYKTAAETGNQSHPSQPSANKLGAAPGERCPYCGVVFAHCSALISHLAVSHRHVHTGVPCAHCSDSFCSALGLMRHMVAMHTDKLTDKTYRCEFCDRAYYYPTNLDRHYREKHAEHAVEKNIPPLKIYECAFCPKTFSLRQRFEEHSSRHTGHVLHVCHTCGLTFTRASSLRRHSMKHSGRLPHVCRVCGKSFRDRYVLSDHMKAHDRNRTRAHVTGVKDVSSRANSVTRMRGKIARKKSKRLCHSSEESDTDSHHSYACSTSGSNGDDNKANKGEDVTEDSHQTHIKHDIKQEKINEEDAKFDVENIKIEVCDG